MSYCTYCGNYVKKRVCARCYSAQSGDFRKEEVKGDLGFSERILTLGIVLAILYLLSSFFFKIINFTVGLLNKPVA